MTSAPRVNPYAVPSGGWKFPVDSTFVSAPTKDDLAFQVISYRRRMGQPVGDVEAELNAYFCERNPSDCLGASPTLAAPAPAASLLARVDAWARSFGDDEIPAQPFVDRAEADRRASTGCIGCAMNQPYGACCGSQRLSGELAGRCSRIRGGQDVTRGSDSLYGCAVFGADTRTLVWLDRERIAAHLNINNDLTGAAPGRCWIPPLFNSPQMP